MREARGPRPEARNPRSLASARMMAAAGAAAA
eukprot:COSAG01_NODE_2351_length_7852_cov_47.949955_9_plen_31_part_01